MSTFHSGYAGTICINQKTAQEILHIYYADGDIPLKVNKAITIPVQNNNVTIISDLFLSEPQLLFDPSQQHRITANIRFYGTLSFEAPGKATMVSEVTIKAKLSCPVEFIENNEGYVFQIGINRANVLEFEIIIRNGKNPKNDFGIDKDDPAIKSQIQFALLSVDPRDFAITYPLLGQLKNLGRSVGNLGVKVFQGVITIGLDIIDLTRGDENQLIDFINSTTNQGWIKTLSMFATKYEDEDGRTYYDSGNPIWLDAKLKDPAPHLTDIGVSINAVLFRESFIRIGRYEIFRMFEVAKNKEIEEAVATAQRNNTPYNPPEIAGFQVRDAWIEQMDNYVNLNLSVKKTSGIDATLTITMKLRVVSTNVDGDTAFLSNQQFNVGWKAEVYDIDIQTPFWLDFLVGVGYVSGFLLLTPDPFIGSFFFILLTEFVSSVFPNIIRSQEVEQGNKINLLLAGNLTNIRTSLPGTELPICSIRMTDFVIENTGMNGWFNFIPETNEYNPLTINGKNSASAYGIDVSNKDKIIVKFSLPKKGYYHPEDPLIRLRWTVYKDELLMILKENNLKQPIDSDPYSIEIDRSSEEMQTYSSFTIYCRVYRPWGDFTEEVFKSQHTIQVFDKLDRRKKYVYWGPHRVFWKEYATRKSNPNRINDKWYWNGADRKSKIHKTDFDVRCKFATEYSVNEDNKLHYIDDLPFPVADIETHRDMLCDFCFFGGPDKKLLKPDH